MYPLQKERYLTHSKYRGRDDDDPFPPLLFCDTRTGDVHGGGGLGKTAWPHDGVLCFYFRGMSHCYCSPRLNGRDRTNEMDERHGGVDQRHGGRHHDHAEERGLGDKCGACFVLKVIVADRANGGRPRTVAASATVRHRRDLIVAVRLRHARAIAFVELDCRFHILWL